MQALSWALTAAAVLLMLYALRVVTQDKDPDKPGSKAGLGCGFLFLACLLWSLAAQRWVGGYWPGFRLGMGIFLATPAIGALTKPHGARLFLGVIGLVLGIVLAGPVVQDLVTGIKEAPRQQLETQVEEWEKDEDKLIEATKTWEGERLELTAELQTKGHADFASLQADAGAVSALKRLKEVAGLIDIANDRLNKLQALIASAKAELEKEESDSEQDELERLLGLEAGDMPTEEDLSLIEEAMQQQGLQELFDSIGQDGK
ncbi:MAG: hypothetical protein O2816_05460 [Planctomycetota bacterium]|nr:hypothetical protein [Planctomycetota bacterium]